MNLGRIGGLALAGTALSLVAPSALAQADGMREFDVPSQDLGAALRQVALLSGRPVIVPSDLVAGLRAPALKGRYLPEQAIALLLRGSGLHAVRVGDTLVVRQDGKDISVAEGRSEDEANGPIVVTGTRIRGQGPVGVPVISLDRKAIPSPT